MNNNEVIKNTERYVRQTLEGESSGHDWWHIYRVWQTAKSLAEGEQVDIFIIELAALLHDIADYKFHDGDELIGGKVAAEWLESQGVAQDIIKSVVHIIDNISFKGNANNNTMASKEGFFVQDADRLDAIGAIGIARCFAYGGHKGAEIYNPEKPFREIVTKEEYKSTTGPSVNHFYEKLLKLKDLMNTEAGKKMAEERHRFMQTFLDEFYKEWEGEK